MKSILTVLVLLPLVALANIIPHNSLNILDEEKSDIKRSDFVEVINKIDNLYRPVIEELGVKFTIHDLWDDGKVNASARKEPKEYQLKIYGGLARFEPVSKDAFILVLCHEIGHLLGGAPTWKPYNFVSSEGQADYYSTLKCFRKYMKSENNADFLKNKAIHPVALEGCDNSFQIKENKDICLRSSLAAQGLARVVAELSNLDFIPQFDTPDPYERMFILFNGYPKPQCRIDTLLAGSLCKVNDKVDVLNNDLYNESVCSEIKGHDSGARPKCWYVPREDTNN